MLNHYPNQLSVFGYTPPPTELSIKDHLLQRKLALEADLNQATLEAKRAELKRVMAALEALDG